MTITILEVQVPILDFYQEFILSTALLRKLVKLYSFMKDPQTNLMNLKFMPEGFSFVFLIFEHYNILNFFFYIYFHKYALQYHFP